MKVTEFPPASSAATAPGKRDKKIKVSPSNTSLSLFLVHPLIASSLRGLLKGRTSRPGPFCWTRGRAMTVLTEDLESVLWIGGCLKEAPILDEKGGTAARSICPCPRALSCFCRTAAPATRAALDGPGDVDDSQSSLLSSEHSASRLGMQCFRRKEPVLFAPQKNNQLLRSLRSLSSDCVTWNTSSVASCRDLLLLSLAAGGGAWWQGRQADPNRNTPPRFRSSFNELESCFF